MNPFPAPRSVLILNNAFCHRSQELKDICEEAGVVLEFLPPYSPDFNPIEESFSALKAWVRRNRQLVDSFEDFGEFLILGVEEFMEGKCQRKNDLPAGLATAETPRCGSLRHHHHSPINIVSNGSAG